MLLLGQIEFGCQSWVMIKKLCRFQLEFNIYQAIVPEVSSVIVFRKFDHMEFDKHLFPGFQVFLLMKRSCDLKSSGRVTSPQVGSRHSQSFVQRQASSAATQEKHRIFL